MCRAEQFYGLLDKIATFLQDIQSKESEQVVGIIELLWTKRLNWIQSERDKIYSYFKVNELSKRMKETYLNELTPISIKESIAISIFEWDIIESVQDPCFIPILDMLHQQIKLEEEHLLQSQNVDESKWSKYGLSTIEVLFLAFSFYSFQSDLIKQEIVNREGIEIAVRFLTHPSAWVRNSAFRLLSIAIDKKIGSEFRKKRNCITILNQTLPQPVLKVISSTQLGLNILNQHLPQLHSGHLQGVKLCVNCDIQYASDSSDEAFDIEYKIIQNQMFLLLQFIKNDNEYVKTICIQMKERIESENKNNEKDSSDLYSSNQQISLIKYIDPLSKVILHMNHPFTVIRSLTTEIIDYLFENGEKDWILQETKEIQIRQRIKQQELKLNLNSKVTQINNDDKQEILKCNLCALPIIFDSLHHQNRDDHYEFAIWSIADLMLRLAEFRYEEKQIKMQKSLENEETDIEVECEQCGEIVQFGLFLKHMKSHNIFNDVNYEINEMVEEIDNDQEDSLKAAQKRIFEDIENEGLMESIQPYAFQKIRTMRNASNSFHKSTLGIRTKD